MARFELLPKVAFTPENIDLEQLAGSFVYFIQALWYDRGQDKVAPLSEIELEICAWAAGEHPDHQPPPPKRGVLAFRGVGKTTLVTAALSCYRYLRMPERQIVTCSKSDGAAKKTVHMIRAWLKSVWFLEHLEPRDDQRDSKNAFDLGTIPEGDENRQPSMSCLGLAGQLENNRAHTMLFDDIETKGNTKTLDGRLELERLAQEGTNIIYPYRAVEDGGPIDPSEIIVLGTVKHVETLYLKLANKGYVFMTVPMEAPAPDMQILNLAGCIKRMMDAGEMQPGDPTMPHRFPAMAVAERKAEGMLEFLMESMCVVGLADSHRYPLRLSDLIVFPVAKHSHPISISWGTRDHNGNSTLAVEIQCLGMNGDRLNGPIMFDPRWAEFTRTLAYIDPAGVGNDELTLAIGSSGAGMVWLHGVWGFQMSSGESIPSLIKLCREFNARDIRYESNMDSFGTFRVSLEDAIRAEAAVPNPADHQMPWNASVTPNHATLSKEARIIATLEPVMSRHNLVVHPRAITPEHGHPPEKSLQYQLSHIQNQPKCLKYDDRADALQGLVGALVTNKPIDRTTEQTAGQRLDKIINDFRKHRQPEPIKGFITRR